MVSNQHYFPDMELQVNSPGGVGENHLPDTEGLHYPDGQHHLFHGITFVVVQPPLKAEHRHPFYRACQKPPGMARGGGTGKLLQFLKRNHFPIFQFLSKGGKAAAQYNGGGGTE